ncbi:MAG: hypothetical protein M1830_003839 [Pleopsidium flavum]|nr:MAG: hypothetical protein M1830_003839 [Pleopsidium flavum]
MASNPDHSSDETSSSLGDSTYEILGDSTFFTSEDEEHEDNTDSVASNDHHTTDDVASLADTEDSNQTENTESTGSHPDSYDAPAIALVDHPSDYNVEGSSAMTAKDHDHPSVQSIEFEEPRLGPGAGQVDVVHTVYKFDHDEASEISRNILAKKVSAQLTATVRQSMTRRNLVLDRPFRVLFIGEPSAKPIIVEKIGAALAVPVAGGSASFATRSRSSRFSVVPVSSFGDRTSPEVELIDSSGLEIIVDHCTSAQATTEESNHGIITLILNDHNQCQSKRDDFGDHLEFSAHWQLPDISIIFCSEGDDITARQTRRHARSFTNRHAVPSIVISREPLWSGITDTITLDHRSPHLCLESRGATIMDAGILKRLPIDLTSFKNIDAGQMNRNLACLTGLHSGKDSLRSTDRERLTIYPYQVGPPGDIEKAPRNTFGLAEGVNLLRRTTRPDIRTILVVGAFFVCTIAYTFATVGYGKYRGSRPPWPEATVQFATSSSPVPTMTYISSHALALASSNTMIPRPTSSAAKTGSVSNTVSIRSTNMDLANLLLNPSVASLNDSDQFMIHVIGDSHIILRPPHSFTLTKKKPKLWVKVSRNDHVMDHQLSKLFEGVYAVKLRREDAYGSMNVSICIKSKPIFNETFVLDFGTPWLKLLELKKGPEVISEQLKKGYNLTLCGLQVFYSRMSTEMQILTGRTASPTAWFQGSAEKAERLSLQGVLKAKNIVLSRATALSKVVSKQSAINSKLLVKRSVRASKKLSSLGQRIEKDVALRANELSAFGIRHLTMLCQAATGVDVVTLWEEISKIRVNQTKGSLRIAQKTALRAWKKLSGAKSKKVVQSPQSMKGRKEKVGTKRNR